MQFLPEAGKCQLRSGLSVSALFYELILDCAMKKGAATVADWYEGFPAVLCDVTFTCSNVEFL
jgi:hypothetical protein